LRIQIGRLNFEYAMEQRLGLCIAFLAASQFAHQLDRPDFVRMDTQDIPELPLGGGQLIVADELGDSSSGRNFTKGNGNH
jgi:hypothetical protein